MLIKCDPRAYAKCPDRERCGSLQDACFCEGSECDKFNQTVMNDPENAVCCEYCDGSERRLMADSDVPYSTFDYITFIDGKAFLHDADCCYIPIKFCPMCGRRFT